MPSHLSEDGNKEKRNKYLARGLFSNEYIVANDCADALAKRALLEEAHLAHIANRIGDDKAVALLLPNHDDKIMAPTFQLLVQT